MTTVIAVTNQKGGVGKTTSTINIAYYLAKKGFKTLLIDFDPQGNATSGLGIDKQALEFTMKDVVMEEKTLGDIIVPTKHNNLWVAPATPQLANSEVELANAKRRYTRLRNAINTGPKFDYVLIDCPPSLSLLTINALISARYVLLPVQVEFYALEGLGQLLETMKLIRNNNLNATLDLLGVLPTMVDSRTSLSAQVHEEIKKHFPGKVLTSVIPRNIRLAEAPSHGLPIGAYDRFSKGARAYKAATKEIIERVG